VVVFPTRSVAAPQFLRVANRARWPVLLCVLIIYALRCLFLCRCIFTLIVYKLGGNFCVRRVESVLLIGFQFFQLKIKVCEPFTSMFLSAWISGVRECVCALTVGIARIRTNEFVFELVLARCRARARPPARPCS
jgi:hypothetical protein